jgi:hypothetical protein
MPRKPKRLRGHTLALHLDKASNYKGVVEARVGQKYLPADYKLSHNIPLNINDAARSYREKEGTPTRGLRDVLKDAKFRSAWQDFRGGGLKRGKPTTTKEKLDAAKVIGWYDGPVSEPIEKLRNVSP